MAKSLIAPNGMVYTNGDAYVKNVLLPDGADDSVWVLMGEEDIPDDDNPDVATDKDYQDALRDMGVSV